MSKYTVFTGIGAAPEPPAPPPCPECMGRCCRNDLGYPLVHLNWDVGEHWCEACLDGTVPAPVRTAEDERAAVVRYLREAANAPHPSELGAPMLSPSGRGLLLLHADFIERGDHLRTEEP